MHVQEQGPPDGDPIVFLHGSMVAGWMWTEQVAALSSTYRTIVPDLPGLGESGSEEWTSFAGVAETVGADLATRAPDGAHVVGLSLGGIVALNLAVSHPESCRSILVSGVPASAVSGALRLLNRAMAAVYSTAFGARIVGRVFGMPDEESMEAFVATAIKTDPAAIRSIVREVSSEPLPDHLDTIQSRVLAVVGANDSKLARDAVGLLVATITDAKGALVPAVGHQWNAEAPALFTAMVKTWVERGEVHPDLTEIAT